MDRSALTTKAKSLYKVLVWCVIFTSGVSLYVLLGKLLIVTNGILRTNDWHSLVMIRLR